MSSKLVDVENLEVFKTNYDSYLTTTLANSSLSTTINATSLQGYTVSGYNNCIPTIGSDGVMEVGRYLDFHYKGSSNDYDTRLQISGQTQNVLILPTSSGTLATTSDATTIVKNNPKYTITLSGSTLTITTNY